MGKGRLEPVNLPCPVHVTGPVRNSPSGAGHAAPVRTFPEPQNQGQGLVRRPSRCGGVLFSLGQVTLGTEATVPPKT